MRGDKSPAINLTRVAIEIVQITSTRERDIPRGILVCVLVAVICKRNSLLINLMVGPAGFEPTTFRPPDGRATKLRYGPIILKLINY